MKRNKNVFIINILVTDQNYIFIIFRVIFSKFIIDTNIEAYVIALGQ